MITIEPGERVDKVVHRHWFVLVAELLGVVLIWALPFALWYYATGFTDFSPEAIEAVPSSLLLFALSLWTLLMWMRVFAVWIDYFLDEWVITDKRIIDVDQRGFFVREISSGRMERVQDVTIEISGVIPTLLDFGDIYVQTAGEARQFKMRNIGRPKHIKELILKNHDAVVEGAPGNTSL